VTFPSSGIDIYAPVFTVTLNEEEIPREDIMSIEIDEEIGKLGMCTISLNDVLNMKTQKFRWLDDMRIQIGALIEISFGYAFGKKKSSFTGKIHAINHSFNSGGNASLQVRGYDLSSDLMRGLKGEGLYEKKCYSEIVKDIAGKYGLETDKIETTKPAHDSVSRKSDEDDLKFIRRLAETINFELFVRNKSLYFRGPKDKEKAEATFTNGINIVSFKTEMNVSTYVSEVQLNYWSNDKKEKNSQTAKQADTGNALNIDLKSQNSKKIILENLNVSSPEEANSLAIAELAKRNENLITSDLVSVGNPSVSPGMTVNVDKVGARFSGTYYVEKTKHSIKQNGYITTLKLRRCK